MGDFMKERFAKLCLFLLIGCLLIWPLNQAFIQTNGYRHLNDTDKFMEVPYDLEIVNLGSSHGMNGFDYKGLEIKGFNMALPAQGFYYDYRILKQFHEHLKKGAVVLIPISYFSLYQRYEGEKFDQFNKRYYRFLEPQYIRFFKPWEYVRYRLVPILFAGEHIKYLFTDRPTVEGDWEAIDYNKFGMDGIVEEGQIRANHHIETIIEPGKEYKTLALAELEKLLGYCIEKGYQPVLVTTPLHQAYKRQFESSFLDSFNEDVELLKANYPGLDYLDYSDMIPDRTDLFIDSDHLNRNGRQMFTKQVVEDLLKE